MSSPVHLDFIPSDMNIPSERMVGTPSNIRFLLHKLPRQHSRHPQYKSTMERLWQALGECR